MPKARLTAVIGSNEPSEGTSGVAEIAENKFYFARRGAREARRAPEAEMNDRGRPVCVFDARSMDARATLRQSPRMLESSLKTKIMDAVDRRFDDQTKVLADLVKIPSTRFQEAPAQDMMARLFKQDGLSVDRWQIKIDDLKHAEIEEPATLTATDAQN